MNPPQARTVLVTGCSAGGIGAALALSFASRGLTVFASARNTLRIPAPLTALPNVHTLTLDVTSPASVAAAVTTVSGLLNSDANLTGGKLDFLVNNAGRMIIAPTLDVDVEGSVREMLDVNVLGMLRVTQAFVPMVVRARGTVVNISSIGAVVRTPWMGVASGSKAAVHLISETLRMELAPLGVKVITVVAGGVKSNILAGNEDYKLPDDSMYKSIEDKIVARARGEDGVPRMETEVFAKKVVEDVLSGNMNRATWRGSLASVVKFMSNWMPSFLDSQAPKGTGLDIMKVIKAQ